MSIQKSIREFRSKLGAIQAAHQPSAKIVKLSCGHCGHEIAETDNFCGLCGTKQLPVGEIALCEKHSGEPSGKFCTVCGLRKRL